MKNLLGLLILSCCAVGACGDDGGSGGGTPDAEVTTASACELYCTNAMANCTGDNELYPAMADCMSACAPMTAGTLDETAGNTAHCRAYHAGVAADDAATHCPHASANGGGVCGADPCESYCDQELANCTGDNASYADRATCMAACSAFPTDGAYNDKTSNSVQCRVYHASYPAAGAPATHCAHGAPSSGTTTGGDAVGHCGTLCEGYCSQIMTNCTGANKSFDNNADCLSACAAFPVGDFNDTNVNSVQCHAYHASFPAAADAAGATAHCPHASPSSGTTTGGDGVGHCGSLCANFCAQSVANCTEFTGATAQADCETACAAANVPVGEFDDKTGDTIQCRTYHASFPSAGDSGTHCPHATINSTPTGQCI